MSVYRYFRKPTSTVQVGPERWDYDRWAQWLLEKDHPRFNSSGAAIRCSARVQEALGGGPVVKLLSDDMKALQDASEAPTLMVPGPQGPQLIPMFPTNPASQWLEFVDAPGNAKRKPPEDEPEAGEDTEDGPA